MAGRGRRAGVRGAGGSRIGWYGFVHTHRPPDCPINRHHGVLPREHSSSPREGEGVGHQRAGDAPIQHETSSVEQSLKVGLGSLVHALAARVLLVAGEAAKSLLCRCQPARVSLLGSFALAELLEAAHDR